MIELSDIELAEYRERLISMRTRTMQGSARKNNLPVNLAVRRDCTDKLNAVSAEFRRRFNLRIKP